MALLGDILIGNITLLVGQDAELHARALASCIVMNRIFATYFVLVLVVFSAGLLWLSVATARRLEIIFVLQWFVLLLSFSGSAGEEKERLLAAAKCLFSFSFQSVGSGAYPPPPG
jgi:hypothetical protein